MQNFLFGTKLIKKYFKRSPFLPPQGHTGILNSNLCRRLLRTGRKIQPQCQGFSSWHWICLRWLMLWMCLLYWCSLWMCLLRTDVYLEDMRLCMCVVNVYVECRIITSGFSNFCSRTVQRVNPVYFYYRQLQLAQLTASEYHIRAPQLPPVGPSGSDGKLF